MTARAAASTSVVVASTLTYHYYPAFLEYPGSISLSLNSARDSTSDVVRSLARFGPRRFYVLNTGLTTVPSLAAAARALAVDGILLVTRIGNHASTSPAVGCASRKVAVTPTDRKWELRGLTHVNSKILPSLRGLFSMIVERSGSAWRIIAYHDTHHAFDGQQRQRQATGGERQGCGQDSAVRFQLS